MLVVAGLIVLVALGVAGSLHLRPSRHPRSIHHHKGPMNE